MAAAITSWKSPALEAENLGQDLLAPLGKDHAAWLLTDESQSDQPSQGESWNGVCAQLARLNLTEPLDIHGFHPHDAL